MQASTESTAVPAVLRDRVVVLAGIAAITLLFWVYLVRMAAMMDMAAADKAMHAAMGMPEMAAWGIAELLMLFGMWAVMMVAMMLPSATPVILLVAGTYRRRGHRSRAMTLTFASGYVTAWTVFSAAAALLQLTLHRAAVLSEGMAVDSVVLGAALLIVAGTYQWLPAKAACLMHCRSPIGFLARYWREGIGGAFGMGVRHGLYCVGCCWALMLLLFAAGVMNLLWVAALAVFVLVEKLVRAGALVSRAAGVLLIVWGGWILLRV